MSFQVTQPFVWSYNMKLYNVTFNGRGNNEVLAVQFHYSCANFIRSLHCMQCNATFNLPNYTGKQINYVYQMTDRTSNRTNAHILF